MLRKQIVLFVFMFLFFTILLIGCSNDSSMDETEIEKIKAEAKSEGYERGFEDGSAYGNFEGFHEGIGTFVDLGAGSEIAYIITIKEAEIPTEILETIEEHSLELDYLEENKLFEIKDVWQLEPGVKYEVNENKEVFEIK